MRSVKLNYHDKEYHLECTAKATYNFRSLVGMTIADILKDPEKFDFDITCKAAAIMSECGELKRRAEGYDKGEMLTEEYITTTASPIDEIRLRTAIIAAVTQAYKTEEPQEEFDPWLAEIEKKKTAKPQKRNI